MYFRLNRPPHYPHWCRLATRLQWRWHCFRHSISHLLRWAPFSWRDDDCDWVFLAEAMEIKLRSMSQLFSDPAAPSPRDATSRKQMLICAALLRRLREDNYWPNAVASFGYTPRAALHADYLQSQDQRYLGRILGHHLTYWWT